MAGSDKFMNKLLLMITVIAVGFGVGMGVLNFSDIDIGTERETLEVQQIMVDVFDGKRVLLNQTVTGFTFADDTSRTLNLKTLSFTDDIRLVSNDLFQDDQNVLVEGTEIELFLIEFAPACLYGITNGNETQVLSEFIFDNKYNFELIENQDCEAEKVYHVDGWRIKDLETVGQE